MAFQTTLRSTETGLLSAFHRAGTPEATFRAFFDLVFRTLEGQISATAETEHSYDLAEVWVVARDRLRLTLRTLRYDRVDPDALRDYVTYVRESLAAALENADDIECVGESIGEALDDIHSYLLAHAYVSADYLDLDRDLAHVDAAVVRSVWTDIVAAYADRPDPPTPAPTKKNDLALAA